MNFIEAITFYKHGNTIKCKGDDGKLMPFSYLLKQIHGKLMIGLSKTILVINRR